MKTKNFWAALATPMMIATLLLAGTPSVTANDQLSAAPAAVTWTNADDIPHTAVSTEGVFKSKVMDTDEKFSYTFTKAGTYAYYCTIHPKMTGQIVVQ